jgi:KaiC domain protein
MKLITPSEEYLKIEPIDSGLEYVNNLFYYVDYKENKLKYLGGYPKGGVINITGEADTGKSILCQLVSVTNSNKDLKTLYISLENPASYVSSSLKRISLIKKIDFKTVTNNVKILDLSNNYSVANNVENFFKELYKIGRSFDICIFDSVSALYENREVMARYIIRRIFQICKNLNLTCFMVSQKREDSPFSSKSAGGLAISHIADCNIVLSKVIISSFLEKKIYNSEIGEVVRIFRIDGCRLCGHNTKSHFYKINEYGYIVFQKNEKNERK